jgi:sugar/nucleoside kinase (ribokinase family)
VSDQPRAARGQRNPAGRLLYLGNVVIDLVLVVPALPGRGGDVLATESQLTPGGGFNVMAAAARQGMPVTYAGPHGSGPFGSLARAGLQREGIDVLLPPRPGQDTGVVVAAVDAEGERTFLTSPGAEATLTSDDLAGLRPGPREVVCLSGYSLAHPANRAAITSWLPGLAGDVLLVFDPGPLGAGLPSAVLRPVMARADWLTCSASEAARLAGVADPAAAGRVLARRTGRGVVVRTGAAGCLISRSDRAAVQVPGFPVRAVDTNGAGDTHTGVFIAALAGGSAEPDAARIANAAAAISVTRRGPATAPAAAEVARFLAAQDRS